MPITKILKLKIGAFVEAVNFRNLVFMVRDESALLMNGFGPRTDRVCHNGLTAVLSDIAEQHSPCLFWRRSVCLFNQRRKHFTREPQDFSQLHWGYNAGMLGALAPYMSGRRVGLALLFGCGTPSS